MADDQTKRLSEIEKEPESAESAAVPEAQAVEETPKSKKKLKLSFPKLGKKKEAETPIADEEKEPEPPQEPLTPEKLVNDIDTDIQILDKTPQEALAEDMSDQIHKVSKNSVQVQVTKKQFVVYFGLVVLAAWMIPLSQVIKQVSQEMDWSDIMHRQSSEASTESEQAESQTDSEATTSARHIRIKTPDKDAVIVSEFVSKLSLGDYQLIDIAEEEVAESEITVAVKGGLVEEFDKISALLEDYQLASSSAVLSGDSDFVAVIIVPVPSE